MLIKLTYHEGGGRRNSEVFLNTAHIVAVSHANPSGTVVVTTRGQHHVAQSVSQVLDSMGEGR